jgi:hypothetical protein
VDITNPQTWNRYAYLANNPLNATDPLGLYHAPPATIAAAATVALAAEKGAAASVEISEAALVLASHATPGI